MHVSYVYYTFSFRSDNYYMLCIVAFRERSYTQASGRLCYVAKNIVACLRYKLIVFRLTVVQTRFTPLGWSLILFIVWKSIKLETFINTKVIYFVCAYACIWINAWLLILVQTSVY
jgi:hypothetical protein